jgi:hypothetical protein
MLITDSSVPPSNSPSPAHPYRAPPLKGMAGVCGSIPITATDDLHGGVGVSVYHTRVPAPLCYDLKKYTTLALCVVWRVARIRNLSPLTGQNAIDSLWKIGRENNSIMA